jgi:hypothetical protein
MHCQAEEAGQVHESAPVQVGELILTVHQATRSAGTFAVLTVDTKPDGSGQTIALRLGNAPDFARALLDLFCRS